MNLADLLMDCPSCKGKGVIHAEYPDGTWTDDKTCRTCRGQLSVPTDAAVPFVALILNVMSRETRA